MKALVLLIVTLAFAVSPFLNPEFGGFDPSRYPVPQDNPPVQPSGYAFSIWGPIYLWLIASAVFGWWKRRDAADWDAHRLPLILSLAVGAAWLPVAVVAPIPATVMILVMLLAALAALWRAPGRDLWWAEAPLGLYAGWLTAASWVAIGLVLAGWGWLSETLAAYVALLGALALACGAIVMRPVASYGAAVVWALVAVAVRNWGGDWGLVGLALAGGLAVAALTLVRLRRK